MIRTGCFDRSGEIVLALWEWSRGGADMTNIRGKETKTRPEAGDRRTPKQLNLGSLGWKKQGAVSQRKARRASMRVLEAAGEGGANFFKDPKNGRKEGRVQARRQQEIEQHLRNLTSDQ